MSSRFELGQMEFSLTLFFAGSAAVEFPSTVPGCWLAPNLVG
jgi:hypothetical protein